MRGGSSASSYRAKRVVAIGGNPTSARAEIVMGARSVESRGNSSIPGQVLRVLVLPRRGGDDVFWQQLNHGRHARGVVYPRGLSF